MFCNMQKQVPAMKELFEKVKAYAIDQNMDVTWEDVKSKYRVRISDLTVYKERRLRLQFEEWITRERTRPPNRDD